MYTLKSLFVLLFPNLMAYIAKGEIVFDLFTACGRQNTKMCPQIPIQPENIQFLPVIQMTSNLGVAMMVFCGCN